MRLYVDMIDVSPLMYENEPPAHRIVVIELTEGQRQQLSPRLVGENMKGDPIYERRRPLSIQEGGHNETDEDKFRFNG
jgi:hypothetical protein